MIREINTIYKKRKRTQERARQEHKINTPFETAVQSYFFCITTHQIWRFSLPPAPSPRPWFSALEKWWEASEINIFLWKGRGRKWRKETKKRRCVRKDSVYQVNSFVQKKRERRGGEEDGKTRKLELKNAQEGIQKAFFCEGERKKRDNEQELLSKSGRKGEREKEAGLELWFQQSPLSSLSPNSVQCFFGCLLRSPPPFSPRHSGASDVGFPQAQRREGGAALQPCPSIDLNKSSRPTFLNMPVPTLSTAYKRWEAGCGSQPDPQADIWETQRERDRGRRSTSHTDLREPRCIGRRREPPRHGETKSMRKSGILRTCCPSLKGINSGCHTCTSCPWHVSTLGNPSSSRKVTNWLMHFKEAQGLRGQRVVRGGGTPVKA